MCSRHILMVSVDLCGSVRKMPATIRALAIVYVCAVFAAPVRGRYTQCLCNLNHQLCVNSRCATDSSCQRIATVTSNRSIKTDDMYCSRNGSEDTLDDILCNFAHRVGDTIQVRYCCVDPYCNANNTYLFEFIQSQLGDEVSDLLSSAAISSATTTRPTATNMPSSTNENSQNESSQNESDSSKIWVIIVFATFVFITLQVVGITIALIIGCRKLK